MSNEFVHVSVGATMTQAEFELITLHQFNSQATGDILYASSSTQLSRLAVGTNGDLLTLTAGVPAWSSTIATAKAFSDDILFSLGTNSDQVLINRSTTLTADTNLTGVLVGASQDTSALAANSLIISNITTDGDILIAASDGGHSKQFMFCDGSTGILHLGKPGTPASATSSGDVYTAGTLEVDGNIVVRTITLDGSGINGGATGKNITNFGGLSTWGNLATLLLDIPIYTPDATDHEVKLQVGSNTILGAYGLGDGAGGVTDFRVKLYEPMVISDTKAIRTSTSADDLFYLQAYRTHANNLDYVSAIQIKNTGGEDDTALLGFFGVAPVNQPDTIADAAGCAGDADDKVNAVIDLLQELGFMA